MRILFVGKLQPGRTSAQRCAAAERLGHDVLRFDTTPRGGLLVQPRALIRKAALRTGYDLDLEGLSERVLHAALEHDADVIWLEKVLSISHSTFRKFKAGRPDRKVVIYHPDDFASRFNWSRHYHRHPDDLDLIVTTKSYNVPEFHELGYSNVMFVNKSFDPVEHQPPGGYDRERLRTEFKYDVGFVGGFERERAEMIFEIARRGVPVHVAGSFWERAGPPPANVTIEHGDLGRGAYAERIFETKINLAFLRKQNRDVQTARSFEIPACGGFMLSERTDELAGLFREGVEAEFFDTVDELHEKCRTFLADDQRRELIARQGLRRVWEGKCRSDDVVEAVLERLQVARSDAEEAGLRL